MSPKIKMSDIHDDRDDDIIELSEDELKEILADDDFDDREEYGEVHSFVFSNSDPYAKVEPRPDDDVVICRCEEITRGEIRRAVHAGMYTMNEVKRFLRAGMGLCQGQSCNKTVRAIIAQELGISPTETDVITARSPVRPVPMGVYGNDTFYPKFLGGGRDE